MYYRSSDYDFLSAFDIWVIFSLFNIEFDRSKLVRKVDVVRIVWPGTYYFVFNSINCFHFYTEAYTIGNVLFLPVIWTFWTSFLIRIDPIWTLIRTRLRFKRTWTFTSRPARTKCLKPNAPRNTTVENRFPGAFLAYKIRGISAPLRVVI